MNNVRKKTPWLQSFSRRVGKSLSPYKKQLLRDYLPQIEIVLDDNTTLTSQSLFGDNRPLALELGFGCGEHLLGRAKANPDEGFIGCEPFINGVAQLLADLQESPEVTNIRLFADDARRLIAHLSDHSVGTIYVLFPDPWPKLRHHKRRIISQETLDSFARIQPEGGRLILATDHEDYSSWMLEHILAHPAYRWCAKSKQDWEAPPEGWVQTRYQQKTTAEGRAPVFLLCERVANS